MFEYYFEIFLALFLLWALISDLVKHKIPNTLILSMMLCGFVIQIIQHSWAGIGYALIGFLAGFIIFMPFQILGGMRAGDLKLMAATGTFLAYQTPVAAGISLMAGAVYGLVVLGFRGGFNEYFSRYYSMLIEGMSTGKVQYLAPQDDTAAASSFPYAIAIVTGALVTLMI